MLSKSDRKELYDWISNAELKAQKGLAMDFRDGVPLLELLMYYQPRVFHRTLIERSGAPSKCKKNWESLQKNELSLLGVKIPETGLIPLYTGKTDEANRPYIEQLLWEVKHALNNFKPKSPAKSRNIRTAKTRSQRKITNYIEELNDSEQEFHLPNIYDNPSQGESRRGSQNSLQNSTKISVSNRSKSAKKIQVKLPPLKKAVNNKNGYSVEDEDEKIKPTWLDRLDGEADGKFLGFTVGKERAPKEVKSQEVDHEARSVPKSTTKVINKNEVEELQKKLKELEKLVQKQEQEILRLSAKGKEDFNDFATPKHYLKKEESTKNNTIKSEPKENSQYSFRKEDLAKDLYVKSITYIEDQSEEVKGKAWINVGTNNGNIYNIKYDEKLDDVKIADGAHRFTDPIETLEFDISKKQLVFKDLAKWLESKECGFENCPDTSKNSILFLETVKHFVTKHTVREESSQIASKKIKLNLNLRPSKEDQKIFDSFRDEVDEKILDLKNIDKQHNQDYTKGVEIKKWVLVASASHEVPHGHISFSMVKLYSIPLIPEGKPYFMVKMMNWYTLTIKSRRSLGKCLELSEAEAEEQSYWAIQAAVEGESEGEAAEIISTIADGALAEEAVVEGSVAFEILEWAIALFFI